MKKIFIILIILVPSFVFSQSVTINETGIAGDPSSGLDIDFNNKGILIPRIALTGNDDIVTIANPATGLIIYNTSTVTGGNELSPGFYFWNGTLWMHITTGENNYYWQTIGNSGTNPTDNFLGTTDNQPLIFKTNNTKKVEFSTKGAIGIYNTGNSVFVGEGAGANDDLSDNANSAFGAYALFDNTDGAGNAAFGVGSMQHTTSGNNSAFGIYSLSDNILGTGNAAFGVSSLQHNTANNNSAFGTYSLLENTSGASLSAFGVSALKNNSSANDNSAFGAFALTTNETGTSNSAFGTNALYNSTANNNSAFGANALINNSTGNDNVAIGKDALHGNTSATGNSAFGCLALNSSNGSGNTAGGWASGYDITGGGNNTSFGYNSGRNISMGIQNTSIGSSASPSGDFNNTTAIGYLAQPTADNYIHIGNTAVSWIGGNVTWSTYSDKRFKKNISENVKGLDFILKLRPVTYNWDINKLNSFIYDKNKLIEIENSLSSQIEKQEKIIYTGFLAQEVEQAAKDADFNFSGINLPKNEKTPYSINYAEFVVPLVKAVQEQQKQIEILNSLIKELNSEIIELKK